uniref:Eukaryotic translation initiation factor 2D-like PUA RNA-binding domain-containing protein n=1 Tax=Oncorhynchus mykiss TaxID=8022 RepID=A0A8K9VEK3_ONCMY
MENCSSSDKEKDRSTQLSDCCISVRPQLFLMCRPLYSSTPTSKGAIKFVLSGANIMCPGLTSPGAKLYPSASETVVAIMVEGKQYALGVGVMKMSAENIFHSCRERCQVLWQMKGPGFRSRSTVSTAPTVLLRYCSLTDARTRKTIPT